MFSFVIHASHIYRSLLCCIRVYKAFPLFWTFRSRIVEAKFASLVSTFTLFPSTSKIFQVQSLTASHATIVIPSHTIVSKAVGTASSQLIFSFAHVTAVLLQRKFNATVSTTP